MPTVLTVDDVAANRRLLRAILEAENMAVLEAGDGVEALAELGRQHVDAIISDVLMPNMDGFRLCLEVRKQPRIGSLPFIIYTSTYNSPSDRKLAMDAGADDYIVKPAPAAALLRALAEAREKAARRRGQPGPLGDEVDVMKQYNAALVAKLEERNAALVVANEELRAGEERFRQLAENIREVFWLTEPDRCAMLYVSPAYETVWGRSVQSLLQAPGAWLEAIHPDDRARVTAALSRQSVRDYDVEYRILRPDGTIRWIRDRAFPVRNPAGEVYRLAGVAEDITERKELEEQFRQAQKMEAIGQLAGGVAHDFNNLLTVIQMRTSMLERDVANPAAVSEGLSEIQDAASRAANLTRQLLMFSRRQTMHVRRLDLNEVVAGILRMLRRIVGEPITLELRSADRPLLVDGDAGMLEQVIMNLVVNARDAMPRGGHITIALGEAASIPGAPSLPTAESWARLVVEDSGTGIPADVLPRIFEPFFTTKEAGRGTGLGLATVHAIVQQHHGRIDVRSVLEHGTTFTIHLPRAAGAEPPPMATVSQPVTATRGHETLLLVEDDVAVRRTAARVLVRHGYQVLEAGSAQAAREQWSRHQGQIRLLLTDLVLPGDTSGRELASELRAADPKLRVVFSSGYRDEFEPEGDQPGAHQGIVFLPKPYEQEQLANTVRRMLDQPS